MKVNAKRRKIFFESECKNLGESGGIPPGQDVNSFLFCFFLPIIGTTQPTKEFSYSRDVFFFTYSSQEYLLEGAATIRFFLESECKRQKILFESECKKTKKI